MDNKLFEDVLDDEFIDIFRPIYYFLTLTGTRGVTIKHKFVTAPSMLYKLYCCATWTVNCFSIAHCVLRCNTKFDANSTDLPLKTGILLNGSINTYLAFRTVFRRGHTHSQLFVKLQRIERALKMKDGGKANRKFARITAAVSLVSGAALVAFFLIFNFYMIDGVCPTATLGSAASTASYFQMCLVIIILYFLKIRARYVNDTMQYHVPEKTVYFQKHNIRFDGNIVKKERVSNELLQGMYCILDSFADVMDVFQHAILLFTFQMLVWQLILMQNLVTTIKMQMSIDFASFLCTLPPSAAYMVLTLTMCLVSQSLVTALETTKQLCTEYTLACEGGSRANAKRMSLLLEGKRDATVYDIFTLGARLPLHLVAITASYTIVLLQFAVL